MRDWLPAPAWIFPSHRLCNTEALWGSWPSLEVPLWVTARQVRGASLSGIRKQRADTACVFFLKSPFYVWGETQFPRADDAAPPLNNHSICSLESKETALVSNLTGVVFLVYILYKRTHQFIQRKQTCNSSSTFVIYKNYASSCDCDSMLPRNLQKHLLL